EDAAADDECGHDCPESPKRYLLHCGVLCRSTPPRAIISSTTYLVLRNSSGSLAIFAAIRREVRLSAGGLRCRDHPCLARDFLASWRADLFCGRAWGATPHLRFRTVARAAPPMLTP